MIAFVPSYALLPNEDREKVKEAYRIGLAYCIEKYGERGVQADMAKKTGLSAQFICNIKQGFSKNFGEKAMQRIAEYFGLSMVEVIRIGEKIISGEPVDIIVKKEVSLESNN